MFLTAGGHRNFVPNTQNITKDPYTCNFLGSSITMCDFHNITLVPHRFPHPGRPLGRAPPRRARTKRNGTRTKPKDKKRAPPIPELSHDARRLRSFGRDRSFLKQRDRKGFEIRASNSGFRAQGTSKQTVDGEISQTIHNLAFLLLLENT